MVEVKLSPMALADLKETRQYIREELENPIAATKVLSKITKNIRCLSSTPYMGATLSSIIDVETDYRFLLCGNYTAFYRIEGERIYVDRILYGRRDFVKLLLGEFAEAEEPDKS